MKIIDYSPDHPRLSPLPQTQLSLEVITAALIFILPVIVLFILAQ